MLDFQAAGEVGDDGVQVPYYAPLPNKRSRVAKNKSGWGSKQGQGTKKPAKPRAKASFPGPVLPGSPQKKPACWAKGIRTWMMTSEIFPR
jgi:hypothetical protein